MEQKIKLRLVAASLFTFSAALLIPTQASAFDADAAQALGKSNGCFKCHDIEKSKKGPSYKKVAEKLKGKPDAVKKIIENITTEPMVKFKDGTEDKHKLIDTKDPKELNNIAEWILAQ